MMSPQPSILVVDDEQGFHDLFQYLLLPLGYMVHSARGGQEAAERLRERGYDVIFLDIHIPKTNSFALLKHIQESYPEERVVLMNSSPHAPIGLDEALHSSGTAGCLHKPFGLEQLLEVLENLVPAPEWTKSAPALTAQKPAAGW